jgi:hypothetical protein
LVILAPVIDKDATRHKILGLCSIAPHVARENSMEASAIDRISGTGRLRGRSRTLVPGQNQLHTNRIHLEVTRNANSPGELASRTCLVHRDVPAVGNARGRIRRSE